MELIGFRESSPAGIILRHIQQQGRTTIKELEGVLGVSTTAVREHLSHLQARGLVETSTVRSGPGRPRLVYTLTDKAQHLFPKQYDVLINLMLQEIESQEGAEKVSQILTGVGDRLAREYSGRIRAAEAQKRLEELREVLEQKGISAAVEPGSHAISVHSCPYFDVAQEHSEICRMEKQMFEQLLGEPLALEHSIHDGHHHCRFILARYKTEL